MRGWLAAVKALIGVGALCLALSPVQAQVTLRGISVFEEGSKFNAEFDRYVERVNKEGKDLGLQIKVLGYGAKVMHPFEMGKALKDGVVDICHCSSAFYVNLMPEAYAFKLSEYTIQELRRNGGYDFIEKLHNEKMNAHWISRAHEEEVFHVYLPKKIDKPDLSGIKIRVSPLHRAFGTALNAVPVLLPPGEIYTALERGTVDGYIWTTNGIFDFGWEKFSKYRVEPPFYTAQTELIVNLNAWKKLSDQQRGFMDKLGLWYDTLNLETLKENDESRKKQASVGIQAIEFKGTDREIYLKKAYDAAWAEVMERAPQNGPRLKELLTGKGACEGGEGPHCVKR